MKGISETCLGMADADSLPFAVGWLRAGAEVGLVVRRCWTSCWKALWGAASTPRLGAMVDGGVVTRRVTVRVLHNHFELHRPILHQQKRHLEYSGGTKFCLSALRWPRKLKQPACWRPFIPCGSVSLGFPPCLQGALNKPHHRYS